MSEIIIQGAKTHNLKNISLSIKRDALTVITGPSGSGKSSLAFDTLFAEGQRRYVESLSAYARQFLDQMEKPEVEHIAGLSPAIAIEQKSTSHNPRSTVGTITEIYDYLRLLYARIGTPRCPTHKIDLSAKSISQMVDTILALPSDTKFMLLAPVVKNRKGQFKELFADLQAQGFLRARVNNQLIELATPHTLEQHQKHTIEVIIDRFTVRDNLKTRLAQSLATAISLSNGIAAIANLDDPKAPDLLLSANFACPHCGYSLSELEPRLFSFNNPQGACPTCDGLGFTKHFAPEKVVANPQVSLRRGAIHGWDENNSFYIQALESLARHYGFSLDKSFNKLAKKHQKIVLYGSGNEEIDFTYHYSNNRTIKKTHPFEGVIPNLERRYHEADSLSLREDLSKFIIFETCHACCGTRLCIEARNVFIGDQNLPNICELSITKAADFFKTLNLTGARKKIAHKIIQEVRERLHFLINVGLEYLNLSRSAETLSGGEAQRIRLASQIGSGLVGVMYILDEPTIGLHPRDNQRLINTLKNLRDLGNSVIVVEHDSETMLASDYIIDIGPGSGKHGGEIVAAGTPKEVMKNPQSITGRYLSNKKAIAIPQKRQPYDANTVISLVNASGNNLKNITADFPLGLITCVTGVSGSGKSTLVNDTLYPAITNHLNQQSHHTTAPYQDITGLQHIDKVIAITQSPIGRTPRSNPATYTGIFTPIRELFAKTATARARGYTVGRFSFNVKGGRCESCQGDGVLKIAMHFLPDMYVNCDLCHGKRYNRETLEVVYKGKNIAEILDLTVAEALEFFEAIPQLKRKLQTLMDVGLSYITLGQNAITLSGGEAQRIKLAKELSKRDTGRTLYLLDEPTTGLHFQDIEDLLQVLFRLRDHGNTIIIIEHNLDIIKSADWIIDLGPNGGEQGGNIIACGTPEDLHRNKKSVTGKFLPLE